jgi:rubrerythrin
MNDPEAQPYWKCSNCAFTLQAPLPPDICPMCRGQCEFKDVSCYLPECGEPS